MLLVHPVHELLGQLPLLIGSVVLGSATGNQMWSVAVLVLLIVFGVARWFTTTYRIDGEQIQRREGVLQRTVSSLPRNRIRSLSTDARLLHRLLGLTVVKVSTGQEVRVTRNSPSTPFGRATCQSCGRSCWPTRWRRTRQRGRRWTG